MGAPNRAKSGIPGSPSGNRKIPRKPLVKQGILGNVTISVATESPPESFKTLEETVYPCQGVDHYILIIFTI